MVHLTKAEELILSGENGEIVERTFRLLINHGDIYEADRMIPVSSAQVAGVSYK